MADTGDFPSVK